MSDLTPALTEDMVARACEAAKADAEIARLAGQGAGVFYALPLIVRAALDAAVGERVVVGLPEPDGRTYAGSARWDASARRIIAKVDKQGRPYVRVDDAIWLDGEAESVGLALVAAAREARRLAAEGGEPHA